MENVNIHNFVTPKWCMGKCFFHIILTFIIVYCIVKEVLYIRVNNPSLNKNIGKYHLPHIWDEVLHNTSELKLK